MECLVEVGALELVKVLRDVECGRILGKVLRVSLVMCYNVVGESFRIRFWYHLWCGQIPLKDLYLDLFSRAMGKEASIFELITISSNDGSRSWNIQFHKALNDWQEERVFSFYEHVYSKMPRGEGIDSLFWKSTPNGVFDVRSFYNSLSTPTFPFPWKCIWSIKVPRGVSFFLWTTTQDSILTIDNLVKRNLSLVNWCCLCRCNEETVDHLLIHYKFAHALWSEVFLMFGLQWVI